MPVPFFLSRAEHPTMQFLPPLVVQSTVWRLAVSEHSAAVLARTILHDDPPATVDDLAQTLAVDPPLALWTLCRAWQEGAEPRNTPSLAAWFTDRAIDLLSWPRPTGVLPGATGVPPVLSPGATAGLPSSAEDTPGATGVPPVPSHRPRGQYARDTHADESPTAHDPVLRDNLVQRYADHVGQSLARAELAAALAAEDPTVAVEELYLVALLHEPAVWFEPAAPNSSPDGLPPLPGWLTPEPTSPVGRWLSEAIGLLKDRSADADERLAVAAGRAAVAARDWASSPAPSVPLAALATRLGRLKALETRMHEMVEAEKLEAMAEFAAGAGHEINNPLAVIAGRAQLLLQEETNPERRRTLALISAQAKRVYEMIADMMLFARPPEPTFDRVNLVDLVDRLVESLQPQMAEQAVTLQRVGHDGPLLVDADPTQLNVALGALCRNALEAIGHGGRIEIALDETDRAVLVSVRDDGPGVSEEARRHLFDPYYSERQAGRGLGLGLSKCWRIVVTNHGGSITVASQPGQQTVFTVTLSKRQADH